MEAAESCRAAGADGKQTCLKRCKNVQRQETDDDITDHDDDVITYL